MARSDFTAQRDAAAELRRAGFARIRAAREFDWIRMGSLRALLYMDSLRAFGEAQAIGRGVVDSGSERSESRPRAGSCMALADAAEWARVKGLLVTDLLALDRVSSDDARSAWQALDHVASIAGGRSSSRVAGASGWASRRSPRGLWHRGPVRRRPLRRLGDFGAESRLAQARDREQHISGRAHHRGIVDGVTSGSAIGVHTQVENHAWVKIDLERSYKISSIRV